MKVDIRDLALLVDLFGPEVVGEVLEKFQGWAEGKEDPSDLLEDEGGVPFLSLLAAIGSEDEDEDEEGEEEGNEDEEDTKGYASSGLVLAPSKKNPQVKRWQRADAGADHKKKRIGKLLGLLGGAGVAAAAIYGANKINKALDEFAPSYKEWHKEAFGKEVPHDDPIDVLFHAAKLPKEHMDAFYNWLDKREGKERKGAYSAVSLLQGIRGTGGK